MNEPEPTTTKPTSENSASADAPENGSSFEDAANEEQLSLIAEFVLFLKENKAWWLVPILLALVLIFVAAWLSSSVAAPFIYPLF
ncbi:DUF5989 family protein [Thalassoglobus neptunius]|uniref:DUF5989 family protein n=1 Tax=Thalassoglobus neptunius TaxID=1938619 RepID=UPI0011B479DB|nr:DUF5989 family protein [Thalassoglobus neptunius]